MDKNKCMALTD